MASRHRRTYSAGPRDGGGVGGGWGGDHAGLHLRGHPPLILRRAQHERPWGMATPGPREWGWLHGIGALTARGLGMTGGWEVGGEAITRDCTYAGPPRSYFDGLSTSGHTRLHGIGALTARGLGGGWEVGGRRSRGWHTRAPPPAHTSRAQHERPLSGWGGSAGPRDDRGVGGGWGGGWGGQSRGIAPMRAPPRPLILREPPASADLRQHERPCPARGFRIGVGNDEDYYARGHLEDARLEVAAKPRLAATSKPCRTRIDVAGLPGCSRPWTRPQSATGPYRAPL